MNIEAIRARIEAATPGPWEWNKSRFYNGYSGITGKDNAEVLFPNHCNDGDDGAAWFEDFPNDADRDFIAHAREDIPTLIAEIERLQAERNKGCVGCAEQGKWNNEIEYGYSCPCLRCSRRCSDNYKLTKEDTASDK